MRIPQFLIAACLTIMLFLVAPQLSFSLEEPPTTNTLFSSEIESASKMLDMVTEFFVKYSFQVLGGIIVLLLGFFIARVTGRLFARFLETKKVDVTISKFMVSILKLLIIAFAALAALGKFGITIAPFIAGLSVVGFAASFALQGPLSNYAAGLTLIFTKPFKVGDIVEINDVMGEVQDITLARTELKTVDGNKIIVPNKHIIGEIIHHYADFKRLDVTVGISYDSDVNKAIIVVKTIISEDTRISAAPEPKVGISEFADSSINIYARLWCKQSDYWEVMFDINKRIHEEFEKHHVVIPFPQRDVHVKSEKTE